MATDVMGTPATDKVLKIFELAENILLYLPLTDLLLSKRVCRALKEVHDNSTRIKRALFLAPSSSMRIKPVRTALDDMRFVGFWAPTTPPISALKYQPILNPFLHKYVQDSHNTHCIKHSSPAIKSAGVQVEAMPPSTPSLDKMLLLQPAARAVDIARVRLQSPPRTIQIGVRGGKARKYVTVGKIKQKCLGDHQDDFSAPCKSTLSWWVFRGDQGAAEEGPRRITGWQMLERLKTVEETKGVPTSFTHPPMRMMQG